MKKNFVLDTNVILHDPQAIYKFEENNVIIPITVVEELDNFKRNIDELGRAARATGRYLDALREQGSLSQGVAIGNGGMIRIDLSADESILPKSFMGKRGDNLILATAYKLHRDHPEIPTVFVTKDINLRLKADALGMNAVDYEVEGVVGLDEMDKGYSQFELADADFNKFNQQGWIEPPDGFLNNRLVIFAPKSNPQNLAYGICDGAQKKIVRLQDYSQGVYGIKPRNPEQYLSLELLLNPKFQMVSLLGKAGTGKTLIGLAAGLHQVLEDNLYQRLLVSRPVFPMGKELGYLPGDVEEKMQPWMQPIFDNLDFIFQTRKTPEEQGKKKGREPRTPAYQDLLGFGIIQVEPLTYIRGRSIPGQYIIVDEAQNLTPHEAKTIITRAGLGTKIVLTGDPYQIDNPYLDQSSNALSYLVNKLKGENIFGHIFLQKGERSQLAELAAERL
jgi:PhoH-like ATPase